MAEQFGVMQPLQLVIWLFYSKIWNQSIYFCNTFYFTLYFRTLAVGLLISGSLNLLLPFLIIHQIYSLVLIVRFLQGLLEVCLLYLHLLHLTNFIIHCNICCIC